MRGPYQEDIQKTPPPGLRMGSKTTQAYLEMRRKILAGEYPPDQLLVPKQIEEEYQINNTTTQVLLARLANEGLIQVLPIRERTWPYNASLNEYRVTSPTNAQTFLLKRQDPNSLKRTGDEQEIEKEIIQLKVQYADAEIAQILALPEGGKVVVSRERHRRRDKMVVAVIDWYFPFWFADALPELEQPDRDMYQLMRQAGKKPFYGTETVHVVQASSVERELFELSPDDPAPLLKIQHHIFDQENQPLAVQFLTSKGGLYRLQYSFLLNGSDISHV